MTDLPFNLIALPENIRSLVAIGTALNRRLETIQHAPAIYERLKTLGLDIYNAQFYLQVEQLDTLLNQEGPDGHYRTLAARYTKKLSQIVVEAVRALDKCTDGAGTVQRAQLGLFSEEIREILTLYGQTLSEFQAFLTNLHIQRQLQFQLAKGQEDHHLERDRFAVFHRYESDPSCRLDHSGNIRRAKGELKDDQDSVPREMHLLLERHTLEEPYDDPEGAQLSVKELAHILNVLSVSRVVGVLECLGYRTKPKVDLVFRIPDNLARRPVETLQSLIKTNNHGQGITIEQKIHIAYGVATAIESVHCSKLIHKSLRPETVLMFSEMQSGPQSQQNLSAIVFRPHLSSWSLLRSNTGASNRYGTNDWTRDMYRHPDRQGLQIEERYTPGHDVYSLGVTLLELGLWESLITWSGIDPRLSPIYIEAAKEVGILHDDGICDLDIKELLRPANARKIIMHLVSGLKRRMEPVGDRYAHIVSMCLRWTEDIEKQQQPLEEPIERATCFHEKVAGSLLDLKLHA